MLVRVIGASVDKFPQAAHALLRGYCGWSYRLGYRACDTQCVDLHAREGH